MKKLYFLLVTALVSFSGNAQISYQTPVCINSSASVLPVIAPNVNLNGAIFTSTPGIIVNAVTGEILLGACTPGSYVITCSIPPSPPDNVAMTLSAMIVLTPVMIPYFTPIAPICSGSVAPVLPTVSSDGIVGFWTPATVSNTATTTYTFTPQGGQCASNAVMSVLVEPYVEPVFDPIPTFCYGSIPPTLPGVSNNGITGIWTVSETNIGNSTVVVAYTFTSANNQCSSTITMSAIVTQPISGFITTANGSDTVYVDENNEVVSPLTLSNEITSDEYTYRWYVDGVLIPDATSGTYTVNTATANGEDRVFTVEMTNIVSGCSSMSNDFVVQQSSGVAPPEGLPNQELTSGSTLADIVISGTGIQWYDSAANKNLTATPLPMSTVLVDNTTYYASQTINGNESEERLPVTVHLVLGIGENELSSVSYFPNPVRNVLTIKALNTIDSVSVINLLGQVLKTTKHNQSEVNENMSEFGAGTYFLRVSSGSRTETIKVIKQ